MEIFKFIGLFYIFKQVRQVMGCANSRFEVAISFNNLVVATIEFKIGVQAFLCEREKRVGSQIILSQILAIQNNNHAQEHKIYVENPFSLKGKTPNNFTIIKSITIIFLCMSYG